MNKDDSSLEQKADHNITATEVNNEQTSHNVARVAVKLPAFWKNRPDLWFRQVEANFDIANITQNSTKFNYVISAVDGEILESISDILSAPPNNNSYESLKNALIQRFADSSEQKLKKLLSDVHLGDRKPSQLLRAMQDLAGNALSEDAVKALWLQRLPSNIQVVLSASRDGIRDLAVMADRILEITQPGVCTLAMPPISTEQQTIQHFDFAGLQSQVEQLSRAVAALSSGSPHPSRFNFRTRSSSRSNRSPSRNRTPASGQPCWYHWRFGSNATKCIQPCTFINHDQGNETTHR